MMIRCDFDASEHVFDYVDAFERPDTLRDAPRDAIFELLRGATTSSRDV